jgi:hypothetical protein
MLGGELVHLGEDRDPVRHPGHGPRQALRAALKMLEIRHPFHLLWLQLSWKYAFIESLKIELKLSAKSPLTPLFQRGEIPPFEKGS